MNAADVLRRAAETLRDKANAASAGPWRVVPADGNNHGSDVGAERWLVTQGGPQEDGGDYYGALDRPDADYIATMHPGVALALADWLDMYAVYVGNGGIYGLAPALAVARAILGETP